MDSENVFISPSVTLVREDLLHVAQLEEREAYIAETEIHESSCPKNRDEFLAMFDLPSDAVVKINYEGKFIPWSLIPYCSSKGSVKIHVFRPHQTVKPRLQDEDMINGASEALVREKVRRLDSRVSSLESSMDESVLQTKTERDLQLVTKQIAFLGKRLDEADRAEWIKK